MRLPRLLLLLLLAGLTLSAPAAVAPAPPGAGPIVQLSVSGPIGPATADYIGRGLKKARAADAALVVLRLDTPGGLDTAMRQIVQDILASPVPVATFVAPSGARAASAGTYILYASHVAAMAPGTNLGAATPVRMTPPVPDPGTPREPPSKDDKDKKPKDTKPAKPDMDQKALNDAIAYIRGLAQARGRNVEWAEKAVREAASLPAEEAVKLKVADLIASDTADLLKKLDGRGVTLDGRGVTLAIKGREVTSVDPDWRSRLLSVITDPNIAYLLMLAGIYGLFFELWNPGYVFPGVLGGICLLLALYAFQVLPISYAGLGLILLGIAFMVAEAFAPSFGALGIGGVIAFAVGSIILIDTDVEGFAVAWPLVATVTVTSAAFFIGVVMLALKARKRAVVSGAEEMVGALGEALDTFQADADGRYAGRVRVHSEEWQARAALAVECGQAIRVTAMQGLILDVEPRTAGGARAKS
jgi:membrane-bound serine protease (ClpP class)